MSGRIEIFEEIGRGSFGSVYRGVDSFSRESVAVKVIELDGDSQGLDEIRQEIALLSNCDNSQIIRYRSSYVDGTELLIIMDYCSLGSFREILDCVGALDEETTIFIAKEVLKALEYLHSNNIIHRDIKAANILLSDNCSVKLGDFGVASQVLNSIRRKSFVGSPYWMAPEVIKRSHYDSRADIWSFGITLIELLTGNPPLAGIETGKAVSLIAKSAPPRLDSSFSEAIRELVASCLHDDPTKRPNAETLLKTRIFRNVRYTCKPKFLQMVEKYKIARKGVHPSESPKTLLDARGTIFSGWTFGDKDQKYTDEGLVNCTESNIDENTLSLLESLTIKQKKDYDGPQFGIVLDNLNYYEPHSTADYVDSSYIEEGNVPAQKSRRGVSRAESNQSLLGHKKKLSLVSICNDGSDDPNNLITEYLDQEISSRNALFKLYQCDLPASESNKQDMNEIYKLMVQLKHCLLEIPTSSDPRAQKYELMLKIEEHKKFFEKYRKLICQGLEKLTLIHHE